ncbi:OCIA domain-containing protein 1-like [Aulostomus maculatus]
MSSSTTGFGEEPQRPEEQGLFGLKQYIPTEEEAKVLKDCNRESLLYRAFPLSAVSMGITQALISKGILSPSQRFGSLPKVALACICGYLIGKVSYVSTCKDRFKNLENSPLGAALRNRAGLPPQFSKGLQSEEDGPKPEGFDTTFERAEGLSQIPTHTRDSEYWYNPEPPTHVKRPDDLSAPDPSYYGNEEPRKKTILYEDLRLKNRENYEVSPNQRPDMLRKAPPEQEPGRPKKEVRTNVYGDSLDE